MAGPIRAMMTQEMIDSGRRCSNRRCPIALLVAAAIPSAYSVSVHEAEVAYKVQSEERVLDNSPGVIDWISTYDNALYPSEPTEFLITENGLTGSIMLASEVA